MVPIIEDKDIIIIIRLFFSALASYLQGTLDEEIGEKTSISFLLDMNELFEEFVGNLLRRRLKSYEIELQKLEHPGKLTVLRIYIDITISYEGMLMPNYEET